MKFTRFHRDGRTAIGALRGKTLFSSALASRAAQSTLYQRRSPTGLPATKLLYNRLVGGEEIDPSTIQYLPPFPAAEKILCVGLNYRDHATESGFEAPAYPVLFSRFNSSLIGHCAPIVRPHLSDQLDYEGELVAVIGKPGRAIPIDRALEHVAGYSIFNDVSVRDYQFKASQWTMGKNFDSTGAFGPVFVTADELPRGGRGLRLQTRLNGQVLQDGKTDDMIFDVATLVSLISEVMTLAPGDLIVTGTPSGVGLAREPRLWMKPGDLCEVEIEGIGTLINPVTQQA